MKRFVFIALLIILGGFGILFLVLKTPQLTSESGVMDFEPFCGTQNLTQNASEGKQIFNANCAACHKLDRIMTGPALRDIAQKYDSLTIQNYLQKDHAIIKTKDYNSACLYFPKLTDEDIRNLLYYTN